MSEMELIKARLREKQRKQQAQKQATYLSILAILLIVSTFGLFSLINHLPKANVSTLFFWNSLSLIIGALLFQFSKTKIKHHEIEKALQYWGFGLIFGIIFIAIQLMGLEEMVRKGLHHRNIYFPIFSFHLLIIATICWFNFKVFKRLKNYEIHSKADHPLRNAYWLSLITLMIYLLILII